MSMYDPGVDYGDWGAYDPSVTTVDAGAADPNYWYDQNAPAPDPSGPAANGTGGGFWDAQGGYYDDAGGYFDPQGGYYDSQGNYYTPDSSGNYQLSQNAGGGPGDPGAGGAGGGIGSVGGGPSSGGGGSLSDLIRSISGATSPVSGALSQFYKDNPLLGTLLNYGIGRVAQNYDQQQAQAAQDKAMQKQMDWINSIRAEKPRYTSPIGGGALAATAPTDPLNYGRTPGGEQMLYNHPNPLATLQLAATGQPVNPGALPPTGGLDPGAIVKPPAPTPDPGALVTARPVTSTVPTTFAGGGLTSGDGGGQDDLVHAMVSPGEYVMDAATVADLGDGSTDAGAKRLDAFRTKLRQHKRGTKKFPPKARAIERYMG